VGRPKKTDKAIYFSEKDVQMLSGFTRSQLQKLDESDLIVPERIPMITYSWNQLIFLRIFYHLRSDWSYKQIEIVLLDLSRTLELHINEMHKYVAVIFGENTILFHEKEIGIAFDFVSEIETDFTSKQFRNYLSNQDIRIGVSQERNTTINVPAVIQELKVLAKELQIENFDLKVG